MRFQKTRLASRFEAFIKLAFGLRSAAWLAGSWANHANLSWKDAKMVGFSAVSEDPFGIPFRGFYKIRLRPPFRCLVGGISGKKGPKMVSFGRF